VKTTLKVVTPYQYLELEEVMEHLPELYKSMILNRAMLTYEVLTQYGSKEMVNEKTMPFSLWCNQNCKGAWTFRARKFKKEAVQNDGGQWTTTENVYVEIMFEHKDDRQEFLNKFALIEKLAA
jgi:hypothetical protein